MMFEERTKKVMKYIWMGLSILLILGMILFLLPGLLPVSNHSGII